MGLWTWLRGGERPPEVVVLEATPGPRFHVVLMNDDTHSYAYVVKLLKREFGLPFFRAFALAHTIDVDGWAVVYTGTRESAEIKRVRVLAAGPDPSQPASTGPLRVEVEEAD